MKDIRVHGVLLAVALVVVAGLTSGHLTSRIGPPDYYPPSPVIGTLNLDVTQENIQTTICKKGWTDTVRPMTSYTNSLKKAQMTQFGFTGLPADYEEDHYVSLELGGYPSGPDNLWPEKYPVARQKDQVEDFLHTEVCNGTITLAQAQKAIVTDWYAIYQSGKASTSSSSDANDI